MSESAPLGFPFANGEELTAPLQAGNASDAPPTFASLPFFSKLRPCITLSEWMEACQDCLGIALC